MIVGGRRRKRLVGRKAGKRFLVHLAGNVSMVDAKGKGSRDGKPLGGSFVSGSGVVVS
jgi:hypothetical protein